MLDFDSLLGTADEEPRDPNEVETLGLVVAAKAQTGEELHAEEAAYLFSTKGLPGVVFSTSDLDDPSVERFANASEYMQAMEALSPPKEDEALAWEAQRIGERLAQWEARQR